jgi:hypothetical protein
MIVESKSTSSANQNRIAAGRPLFNLGARGRLGWVVSGLAHLLIIAVFLVASSGKNAPSAQVRLIPTSTFEQPSEPLQPEPIIDNLKVEPPMPSPMSAEPADPPPLNSLPPAPGIAPAIAALTSNSSSYVFGSDNLAATAATRFCGVPASGNRICYIIDCSGSMVMALDYVRREVQRTVSTLNPGQYFNVIFFAGGDPIQLMPPQLRRANLHQRRAALDFIKNVPLTNVPTNTAAAQAVISALKTAFTITTPTKQTVQTVYLFTDGEFDNTSVAAFVTQMQQNRPTPVVINVIACGSRDNETFLRQLATKHKGRYRFLSDEHLAGADL